MSRVKHFLFSVIIIVVFFLSLELSQRVRYFLRYKSTYWLKYGFVGKPDNYEEMQERGKAKERLTWDVIEVPTIIYEGYVKFNPMCKTAGHKINSFGFRGDEFDIQKKEGVFRIVALGASTTFGVGADDGFTYPEYLARILNSRGVREFEVINAGIPSADIGSLRILFEKEVIDLSPDMIIINSIANNIGSSQVLYKFNFGQRLTQKLLDISLFYMTLREKLKAVAGRPIVELYRAPLREAVDGLMKDDELFNGMRDNYKRIITMANENGIKVVILKQLVLLRYDSRILLNEGLASVWERMYELIEEIGEENGAAVVDLPMQFSPLENKESYFTDGLHLTAKGNAFIAEVIVEVCL